MPRTYPDPINESITLVFLSTLTRTLKSRFQVTPPAQCGVDDDDRLESGGEV